MISSNISIDYASLHLPNGETKIFSDVSSLHQIKDYLPNDIKIVFPGRFQPMHIGHTSFFYLISEFLQKKIFICIGSTNKNGLFYDPYNNPLYHNVIEANWRRVLYNDQDRCSGIIKKKDIEDTKVWSRDIVETLDSPVCICLLDKKASYNNNLVPEMSNIVTDMSCNTYVLLIRSGNFHKIHSSNLRSMRLKDIIQQGYCVPMLNVLISEIESARYTLLKYIWINYFDPSFLDLSLSKIKNDLGVKYMNSVGNFLDAQGAQNFKIQGLANVVKSVLNEYRANFISK